MNPFKTNVFCAYNDTFCIQRTDNSFFNLSAEEINPSTTMEVDGKTYKLLLRHLDIGGQMFFYILNEAHTEDYVSYYSGPTEFEPGTGVLAWECAPEAYIGASSLLCDGQEISIIQPALITSVEDTQKLNFIVEVPKHYENLDVKVNYDGNNLNFNIKLKK